MWSVRTTARICTRRPGGLWGHCRAHDSREVFLRSTCGSYPPRLLPAPSCTISLLGQDLHSGYRHRPSGHATDIGLGEIITLEEEWSPDVRASA
jgi:hypothetical protein